MATSLLRPQFQPQQPYLIGYQISAEDVSFHMRSLGLKDISNLHDVKNHISSYSRLRNKRRGKLINLKKKFKKKIAMPRLM